MSTVLCLSSQVARGYVGGAATRIALERLGHDCWLLPTVILSNHPGHARFAGEQVPVGRLRAMLEAMEANGWLGDVDAVITGYMPSAEHVAFAIGAIEMVRKANPDAVVVCDPILGDEPGGLYVDDEVAAAIRDDLVPLASIVTPNRFELEYLSGAKARRTRPALRTAAVLGVETVLVTSVTGETPQDLVNLLVNGKSAWASVVDRRKDAPHGAGDLMAALFLGQLLKREKPEAALALATSAVETALDESEGADELHLATATGWTQIEPWPVEPVKS